MIKETLIVVDTETGGLDPKRDSLLTVAFVVLDGTRVIAKQEWKIKHPTYHVTAKALEVNGIDLVTFDKEALPKEQVAHEMITFLGTHCSERKGMFVGQNTIFDKAFIENFLKGLNDTSYFSAYKDLISRRYVDLMSITAFLNMAGVLDTDGLGLDKVIETFNLPVEARHTALDDAKVTLDGLVKMIGLIQTKQFVS
ncbi:3'-5' exonuclease (plasmid) [Aneurinibacillus sp. Ricciae_BoGa-3]|uniref:3'-5' exonuclease n=1 Tax=Aneurinibacillus sp. Ricciae_BoGa-3 TaxID=3022697 RepID=UPI002342097B|nr:3'-5' exonuclease [Aneurinibacillus sp. Ricciae_BoGa-3]WCK57265.1 3'-5' exonuclease [Aneurinibacillus sp. Ricciae_BoGa-3]